MELTPEQILQAKIDELVAQISENNKIIAQQNVEIAELKIKLDNANHIIDARTTATVVNDDVAELIDENELSKHLMESKD